MIVVRNLSFFQSSSWQQVRQNHPVGVTIGNFDGMHRGHQALFKRLTQEIGAASPSLKVMITFVPHPRRFFSEKSKFDLDRDSNFRCLMSVRDKLEYAGRVPFDLVFLVRFDAAVSALAPSEFVKNYLRDSLRPEVIVVGDDWRFGKNREGGAATLHELAAAEGFRVITVPAVEVEGVRVGSRHIKHLIEEGKVQAARDFLGRPFSLAGRVRHGDMRGRKIGFPTANLEFVSRVIPQFGVYASHTKFDGQVFSSVTNVGVRPTFSPPRLVVETHILGLTDLNLYGKRITVEFVERLREEKRFSSVDELKNAISEDIVMARRILA